MQKVKNKGHSVQKFTVETNGQTDGRTDGGDCINLAYTSRANAVGAISSAHLLHGSVGESGQRERKQRYVMMVLLNALPRLRCV